VIQELAQRNRKMNSFPAVTGEWIGALASASRAAV